MGIVVRTLLKIAFDHHSPRQKLEDTERDSKHTREDDKWIPPRFGLNLQSLGVQLRDGGSDLIVLRRVIWHC